MGGETKNSKGEKGLPIPIKYCLKFNPPKLAVIYQFDSKKRKKKYCHDIALPDIETKSAEEVCDRIFDEETFYLDPKGVNKG
jgi:hypothetical protein